MFKFGKILDTKLVTLGLVVGVAGIASADEIFVAGSTLGAYNGGPFVAQDTLLGLVFDNSTFSNNTVGGMLDLGGNPMPGANFNNLGSFSLAGFDANYNGNSFNLEISFTSPTVIAGGTTAVFTDVITGTVQGGQGGVFIDFDNTPQMFTFTNATETGWFTMFVNDVSIAPGQAASLTGHIEGAQTAVPEPMTMIGLACGVLGFIRKRKARVS